MKEILVIRHGELDNPRGIVYNRDSVMREEDIIHLSEKGRAQFPPLVAEIKKQNKVPSLLWCSPETRAKESAAILQKELGLAFVKIEPRLDDVYGPGPYIEGMIMREFEATRVNNYDHQRWGKYGHESAEAVTERMLTTVVLMVAQLQDGEVCAMVSHGDPIAFLLNYLQDGVIPDPAHIRNMLYPGKGSATLLTYSDADEYISQRPFGDLSLRGGSNY